MVSCATLHCPCWARLELSNSIVPLQPNRVAYFDQQNAGAVTRSSLIAASYHRDSDDRILAAGKLLLKE